MKTIKKFFPMSTWFGFTGTPIFEENKKQENGTYARTTHDQYGIGKDGIPLPNGGLLHAYTTKNAMDDKSVLDFQVEYHSLMSEEEEERLFLTKAPIEEVEKMDAIQKEALLAKYDYENDNYIETMLKKIFRHQSVLEKFKVVNGIPTMSGILTTHSIVQAKRIYHKLIDLKKSSELITGKPLDDRRRLNDPDFPRVAITYSISENQEEMNTVQEEIEEIMREYGTMYGDVYTDVDLYNQNINNRLARKSTHYQKDGKWLDLVIVVDRLLTGFDAPTIQTLYVDKELKWHGLLQAFSRTNRVINGKSIGMIVTFRKPHTMSRNVEDAIRLFSNEERDWESLIPKSYAKVRQDLENAHKAYIVAKAELEKDSTDLKKKIEVVKTFQSVKRLAEATQSYEEYENDYSDLSPVLETVAVDFGHIENIKAEVREEIGEMGGNPPDDIFDVEFSADQRATLEETIDSYYISQLLKDIKNEESKRKFDEILLDKPAIVQEAYGEILPDLIVAEPGSDYDVGSCFKARIDKIILETASIICVPEEDLRSSLSEYSPNKEVPFLNILSNKSKLTKDSFLRAFPNEKFRRRTEVIGDYWKNVMDEQLVPLRKEMASHEGGN
jgi:type I restriction enzyme R subunit